MRKHWMLVLAAAVGLGFAGASLAEEKVKFSELSPAVRATFNRAANGVKIEEVEEETKDGKTYYEADVTLDGAEYEIKVAADGTLISKERDDEEDEKDEGDKKD